MIAPGCPATYTNGRGGYRQQLLLVIGFGQDSHLYFQFLFTLIICGFSIFQEGSQLWLNEWMEQQNLVNVVQQNLGKVDK